MRRNAAAVARPVVVAPDAPMAEPAEPVAGQVIDLRERTRREADSPFVVDWAPPDH